VLKFVFIFCPVHWRDLKLNGGFFSEYYM